MLAESYPGTNWLNDHGVWEHLLTISTGTDVREKSKEAKQRFMREHGPACCIKHISVTVHRFPFISQLPTHFNENQMP